MSDKWMVNGMEFGNCNCAWGCPCQFSAPSTHGFCEAIVSGHVMEGHFNETSLNGLNWVLLVQWPGEIAAGNGKQQAIIDERADPANARRYGRSFTASPPHRAPRISLSTTARCPRSSIRCSHRSSLHRRRGQEGEGQRSGPGRGRGHPMISPFSGEPARARIHLPDGFEYTYAEVGTGTPRLRQVCR